MNIAGIQKLTLLDYPGHTAAIVFLNGCDFKCPFCHNAEIININNDSKISLTDLEIFLEKRKNMLDGIVVTGGEPCIQKDLKGLLILIKKYNYLIKLDTNGNHPDVLNTLLKENLVDYIAMDIKNSLEKYPKTIGVPNFNTKNIEKSIEVIKNSNIEYEFRTTVIKDFHTENDFIKIGNMLGNVKSYYLQQFILSENVPDVNLKSPSIEDMKLYLEIVKQNIPNSFLRGI